jgi:hypothetical protein
LIRFHTHIPSLVIMLIPFIPLLGQPLWIIGVTNDHRYALCLNHRLSLSSFMTYHQICNKSNTAGATSWSGSAYPSEFTLVFSGVCVCARSVFYVILCQPSLVLFHFALCFLFFFELRLRRGFATGFVNYKKGALDSQPQVIKFTSCFPIVGGSLWVLRLLPPLKLVAMI